MARPRKYPLYCDPDELHNALLVRKSTGNTNNRLGEMYNKMIEGIISRPNYSGYYDEVRDTMLYTAIHNLIKYMGNYNPNYYETNKNAAFTYCTRIIMQAFNVAIVTHKAKKIEEDSYLKSLLDEMEENYNGMS